MCFPLNYTRLSEYQWTMRQTYIQKRHEQERWQRALKTAEEREGGAVRLSRQRERGVVRCISEDKEREVEPDMSRPHCEIVLIILVK